MLPPCVVVFLRFHYQYNVDSIYCQYYRLNFFQLFNQPTETIGNKNLIIFQYGVGMGLGPKTEAKKSDLFKETFDIPL